MFINKCIMYCMSFSFLIVKGTTHLRPEKGKNNQKIIDIKTKRQQVSVFCH